MEPRLPPPPPRLPPPPPPPPPRSAPPVHARPLARAGELSGGWRVTFVIGWSAVVLSIAGIWKASRIVGLSTWWLGPPAQPRLVLISILPVAVALVVVALGVRNTRGLPWIGIAASLILIAVGLGDVGRFDGIAIVELAVGVAALLLSVAAFAGVLRATPADAEPQR